MEKIVAYFSATGTTKEVAEKIAHVAKADLFEIKPSKKYTDADLDWQDKNSRSSKECANPSIRPEIAQKIENFDKYNTIFIGFPIWWYKEPNIIDTFVESYDFSGKMIVLFATSGGSGITKSAEEIKKLLPKSAKVVDGKMLNYSSEKEIKEWLGRII